MDGYISLIVQSLVAWWCRGAWSSRSKEEAAGGGWCAGRKEVDFICKTKKEKILFLSTYSAVGTSLTHDSDRAQNQPKSNAPLFSLFKVATTLINHGRVHEKREDMSIQNVRYTLYLAFKLFVTTDSIQFNHEPDWIGPGW